MATDPQRVSQHRSIAAHQSWADTPDRTARTAPGHRASPLSIEWHEARIREKGGIREQDIPAAARNAWKKFQREASMKGVEARRANAGNRKKTSPPREERASA